MSKSVDLREKKGLWFVLLAGSLLSIICGIYYSETSPNLWLNAIVLLLGAIGVAVSIYYVFSKKGNAGISFYSDYFLLELSTGEKYFFKYRQVKLLGIQEVEAPGQKVNENIPTNVKELVSRNGNINLAIKFRTGATFPSIYDNSINIYTGDKLSEWEDHDKMDLYFGLYNRLGQRERIELIDFLQSPDRVEVVPLPPLRRK